MSLADRLFWGVALSLVAVELAVLSLLTLRLVARLGFWRAVELLGEGTIGAVVDGWGTVRDWADGVIDRRWAGRDEEGTVNDETREQDRLDDDGAPPAPDEAEPRQASLIDDDAAPRRRSWDDVAGALREGVPPIGGRTRLPATGRGQRPS